MNTQEIFVRDRYAIAVTSLVKSGSNLYLGLTGGPDIIACYDPAAEMLETIPEVFPWVAGRGYCSKIHNAMGVLADGSIVAGEGNHFTWDGIPVTVNYFEKELPEFMLARKKAQGYPDIKYTDFCRPSLQGWDRTATDPGGRIIRYFPGTGEVRTVAMMPQYLYVQSMVVDPVRNMGYGHTLPDNHFFTVDFTSGELKDYGHISDYAHHNMVVTPDGICYGGWLDRADGALKLLKFDPAVKHLEYLDKVIMAEPGPKIAGNQGIDQWLVTRSGRIFMGAVHHSCFYEFDYRNEEFKRIEELSSGGRVSTMNEDDKGMIWIGVDYPNMRLVSFDPNEGTFHDYGVVNDKYPRCYFHASVIHDDKLYLGETDCFSPSLHIVNLGELQNAEK